MSSIGRESILTFSSMRNGKGSPFILYVTENSR